MACFETGTIVDLVARESLLLVDARGMVLRVNRGTLWITQEHDTRDTVLRPGDTWVVERNGTTIVEAQTAATFCATGKAVARALAADAPRDATLSASVLARMREGLAAWWSLTPQRHVPHV